MKERNHGVGSKQAFLLLRTRPVCVGRITPGICQGLALSLLEPSVAARHDDHNHGLWRQQGIH